MNISPDLEYFDTSVILPCGIEGRGVTSIERELSKQASNKPTPTVAEVADVVLQKMGIVFGNDVLIEFSDGVTSIS